MSREEKRGSAVKKFYGRYIRRYNVRSAASPDTHLPSGADAEKPDKLPIKGENTKPNEPSVPAVPASSGSKKDPLVSGNLSNNSVSKENNIKNGNVKNPIKNEVAKKNEVKKK